MKIKSINNRIKTKLSEWLNTISDKELRKRVEDSLLVSGGCIASMLLDGKVNDYDVYIQDKNVLLDLAIYYSKNHSDIKILDGKDRDTLIKEYSGSLETDLNGLAVCLRNLKEDQIKLYFEGSRGGKKIDKPEEGEEEPYTPVYFSANAITLSDDIQIILRFYGTPEEIHSNFDFVHCTNYYTTKTGVVTNIEALESLITKSLKYNGSKYPLTSVVRTKKFLSRDFTCGAGEYLKMMYQISKLNLDDIDVLEEQLVGVDVAFTTQLIDIIRGKMSEDTNWSLTTEYLTELVEKVFHE